MCMCVCMCVCVCLRCTEGGTDSLRSLFKTGKISAQSLSIFVDQVGNNPNQWNGYQKQKNKAKSKQKVFWLCRVTLREKRREERRE